VRGPGACPELAEGVRYIKIFLIKQLLTITLKTNPKATHARFVSLKKYSGFVAPLKNEADGYTTTKI
jgi:hypothetical protein